MPVTLEGDALQTFESMSRVEAPLQRVWSFHREREALRKLTPPLLPMTITRWEPLAEGSIVEFKLWLGPFALSWKARHRDVGCGGFTDEQVEGPFEVWVHRHSFRPARPGGTWIHDRIQYRHPRGRRGWLTRLLFSRPLLRLLFWYRGRVVGWQLSRPVGPATPQARTEPAS